MTARLLAFVVWAAVAATAVFWALRLFVPNTAAPRHAVAAAPTVPRGDLARVLGAEPVETVAQPVAQASNRFKLVGLVSPRPGTPPRVGVALIAVDDKPARAFRVGASVDGRLVVQAVQGRSVSLGPRGAPAELELELPPLPAAATGKLPLAGEPTAPVAPPPPTAEQPIVNERPAEPPPNEAAPGPR
jgi:general secretion pathway protein C